MEFQWGRKLKPGESQIQTSINVVTVLFWTLIVVDIVLFAVDWHWGAGFLFFAGLGFFVLVVLLSDPDDWQSATASSSPPRVYRETIPQKVKDQVWQRDGGRCVECRSNERLEFDHIIPLVMGGANTYRNLQLLCQGCNRRKGGTLGRG